MKNIKLNKNVIKQVKYLQTSYINSLWKTIIRRRQYRDKYLGTLNEKEESKIK